MSKPYIKARYYMLSYNKSKGHALSWKYLFLAKSPEDAFKFAVELFKRLYNEDVDSYSSFYVNRMTRDRKHIEGFGKGDAHGWHHSTEYPRDKG